MRGNVPPSVVVVGAGPVGLAAALTLSQRGVPVDVVERDDRSGTHSYALALHPATQALMRQWGADPARLRALQVRTLQFCDHSGPRFDLDLTAIPGQSEGLLVVGQDQLETALLEPLMQAGVPVHWSHRLAGLRHAADGVELDLERLSEVMSGYAMARLEWQVDKELSRKTGYVIGADGHLSMVRRKLGIEFPKVAPTQSFAVFEFRTDFDAGPCARIVFGPEGTSILWPLPGGYCRWGFEISETAAEQYSRDKDRLFMQVGAHGYRVLEKEMLAQMLEQRAPWFDGMIGEFRWRMIVRFEKRLAERFGNGRVWLAGDAAHLAAPIGMQSMNIGIREAGELANLIADALGGAEVDLAVRYGQARKAEWRALMGLDAPLIPGPRAHPLLAQYADRLLGCIPAARDSLPHFAAALGMVVG